MQNKYDVSEFCNNKTQTKTQKFNEAENVDCRQANENKIKKITKNTRFLHTNTTDDDDDCCNDD